MYPRAFTVSIALLAVAPLRCFSRDVGLHYIKSALTVNIDIGDDSLSIKDKSSFCTNRYLRFEDSGDKEKTMIVHDHILVKTTKGGSAQSAPIKEPVVAIKNGTCARLMQGGTASEIHYLLQVRFDKNLPEVFDFSFQYQTAIKWENNRILLKYFPMFENEDFIPPIFFGDNSYRIIIKTKNSYTVNRITPGGTYREDDSIVIPIENHEPVTFEVIRN